MSDLFATPAPTAAPQPTEQPPVQPTAPTYDHLLTSLQNAQGEQKYATIEHAFDGFAAAQQHIAKLEAEAIALREQAAKAKSVEDILAAVQPQGQPEPAPVASPAPVSTPEVDIASLVQSTIAQNERTKMEEANRTAVINKAKEAFGDKAGELFYSKAAALGMDKATINGLASTSPQAVYNILGLSGPTPQAPQIAGINTESFQHNESVPPAPGIYGKKDAMAAEWAYIRKLAENS